MKRGKTVIDWWTKYVGFLALPILIGAVLFAWLQPTNPAGWFCKTGDPCLQQWVSALSGWVAGAAAFVTLKTINKQRTDAVRHHSQLVELEIMKRVAVARRFVDQLWLVTAQITALRMTRSPANQFDTQTLQSRIKSVENLIRLLGSPKIAEYEADIGAENRVRDAVVRLEVDLNQANHFLQDIKFTYSDDNIRSFYFENFDNFDGCAQYASKSIAEAQAFIKKWESRYTGT